MTIANGLATQSSPAINKSEYRVSNFPSKLSFRGKLKNIKQIANDTFESSCPINKSLDDIAKESALRELRYRPYRSLQRLLLSMRGKNAENICKYFGVKAPVLKDLAHGQMEKLISAEQNKNKKFIKEYKIGEFQIENRNTHKPVKVELTNNLNNYEAFVNDLKTGENVVVVCKDYLYGQDLASFDNDIYKGLGTKFHQIKVEHSLAEGLGGRVHNEVMDPSAKVFHYKCGFRKVGDNSDKFSQLIEDVIAGKKQISDIDDSIIEMHLPEDQINRIIESQIKPNPILESTKDLIKNGKI